MSFNDYYVPMPALNAYTLAQVGQGIAVATGVLTVAAAGLLLALQHSLAWLLLAAPIALLLAALGWLGVLWQKGSQPFPTGVGTDLPSVLKALYVQQRFALLAAELQGADASAVHARFGDFLRQVRPADPAGPTQAPGVIRSDGVPLVAHPAVPVKAVAV